MAGTFNWWWCIAPVMLIVSYVLGRKKYYLENRVVRSNYSKVTLEIVAIFCAVLFGLMLALESSDGLVSIFDKGLLDGESGMYSIMGAVGLVILSSALYGLIAYAIALFGAETKKASLKRRLHR